MNELLSFYSLWKSKSVEGSVRVGIQNTGLAFLSLHTDPNCVPNRRQISKGRVNQMNSF